MRGGAPLGRSEMRKRTAGASTGEGLGAVGGLAGEGCPEAGQALRPMAGSLSMVPSRPREIKPLLGDRIGGTGGKAPVRRGLGNPCGEGQPGFPKLMRCRNKAPSWGPRLGAKPAGGNAPNFKNLTG